MYGTIKIMKILIVEDEEMLQQMYRDAFEQAGFDVFVASNGKEGIVEAAKEQPDFILLDIMMPEMDGVTAFGHLKEMEKTKVIPVGFLTVVPEGVPESLHHDPELLKGAVTFWRKDKISPHELVAEVTKIIQR